MTQPHKPKSHLAWALLDLPVPTEGVDVGPDIAQAMGTVP